MPVLLPQGKVMISGMTERIDTTDARQGGSAMQGPIDMGGKDYQLTFGRVVGIPYGKSLELLRATRMFGPSSFGCECMKFRSATMQPCNGSNQPRPLRLGRSLVLLKSR
jgi:hypothetical protein